MRPTQRSLVCEQRSAIDTGTAMPLTVIDVRSG
jgi:hypothetical protein